MQIFQFISLNLPRNLSAIFIRKRMCMCVCVCVCVRARARAYVYVCINVANPNKQNNVIIVTCTTQYSAFIFEM